MRRLYLCDGNRCCKNHENCYTNGGDCYRTTDEFNSISNSSSAPTTRFEYDNKTNCYKEVFVLSSVMKILKGYLSS